MQSQTTVTKRWQTVIPAAIRRQLRMKEGDKLVWIFDGASIRVVVLPADPIKALRGSGRGERLTEKLLAARREDRERETRQARLSP